MHTEAQMIDDAAEHYGRGQREVSCGACGQPCIEAHLDTRGRCPECLDVLRAELLAPTLYCVSYSYRDTTRMSRLLARGVTRERAEYIASLARTDNGEGWQAVDPGLNVALWVRIDADYRCAMLYIMESFVEVK